MKNEPDDNFTFDGKEFPPIQPVEPDLMERAAKHAADNPMPTNGAPKAVRQFAATLRNEWETQGMERMNKLLRDVSEGVDPLKSISDAALSTLQAQVLELEALIVAQALRHVTQLATVRNDALDEAARTAFQENPYLALDPESPNYGLGEPTTDLERGINCGKELAATAIRALKTPTEAKDGIS